MENKNKIGRINWFDLTVNDAEKVSDFYHQVVGWEKQPVNMHGYEDFCMNETVEGETVAGICHAKGSNKSLPPQWLIYITVENLAVSLEMCKKMGGKVMGEITKMGDKAAFCLIQDPAGAYAMLYQDYI